MHSEGYRLSILGIGTREGAPINLPDGSFFKDQSGQIVIPKLNEEPMRRLSQIGGGRSLTMTADDKDLNELVSFFSSNFEESDLNETDFETDVWREQGPWLLLLLAPLAALAFRRGVLIMLFIICLPFPRDGMALDWESLWFTPDQRAEQILNEGDAEAAADLFENPAWKGAAHYRASKFDDAIRSLQETEDIESQYNLGNALARKGLYEEAIAMYNKVLEQIPDHEDARYNKELLEEEMQQQQQQQESFNNQNQEQQEQQQQQQQQDQQQQQQDQAQQQQDQQQQQQDQAQQQETEQESDQGEEQPPEEQEQPSQPEPLQASEDQVDEEQQATEQWLRRIPDDPGGLLRRKFLLQYQQRQHERIPGEKSW
jgi:Ca-activated chloride channel family protein